MEVKFIRSGWFKRKWDIRVISQGRITFFTKQGYNNKQDAIAVWENFRDAVKKESYDINFPDE